MDDNTNIVSINRYETQKNIDYQYRKGFFAGLTLQTVGYGNELGKTSKALDSAYIAGWKDGTEQHRIDIQQAMHTIGDDVRLVA